MNSVLRPDYPTLRLTADEGEEKMRKLTQIAKLLNRAKNLRAVCDLLGAYREEQKAMDLYRSLAPNEKPKTEEELTALREIER